MSVKFAHYNNLSMSKKTIWVFISIVGVAIIFRTVGFNWDQGQHLHPDERFLTMVGTSIRWPGSFAEYFDTDRSPLNPHNHGFNFFVYGTLPLFFMKAVAQLLGRADYVNFTLVGRILSGLIDTATVVVVFFITMRISKKDIAALCAAFFYAVSVLPIQLSHFATTDTHVTFFASLSLLLMFFPLSPAQSLLLGFTVGLAAASKISALALLPIVLLSFGFAWQKTYRTKTVVLGALLFTLSFIITLRIAYPYLFAGSGILATNFNPRILANWRELKSFDQPDSHFPPAVQWINTVPLLFPFSQMIVWGFGLPLGLLVASSVAYAIRMIRRNTAVFLIVTWIILVFLYQGVQFAKAMRYFAVIYPALAVLCGIFVERIIRKFHRVRWLFPLILAAAVLWPLTFTSIYRHPHTRVTASRWIYRNIPNGSNIAIEHWDDPLPLYLEGERNTYSLVQLPLYDPDSNKKWEQVSDIISQVDYIILSSNRLYGSITRVPDRYPETSRYYEALFAGDLGFSKVAEFTSRPNLPIPFTRICVTPPFFSYGSVAWDNHECPLAGVSIVDDYAEEFFTVYDHPKVIIFRKTSPIDYSSFFSAGMR